MYGPGHGWGFGILGQIGAFFGGLILTAAIVVLTILLVRYLIVATRAAQIYVDAHSGPAGTTPAAPPAATPPPATPPTPAPRSRTPKTPPAV